VRTVSGLERHQETPQPGGENPGRRADDPALDALRGMIDPPGKGAALRLRLWPGSDAWATATSGRFLTVRFTLHPAMGGTPSVADRTLEFSTSTGLDAGGSNPGGSVMEARWFVTGDLMIPGVAFEAAVFMGPGCDPAPDIPVSRFPASGPAQADLVSPGGIVVRIVPFVGGTPDSVVLPNTSATRMDEFRQYAEALFPLEFVDIEVRTAVSEPSSNETGLISYLTELEQIRVQEPSRPNVYYMGVAVLGQRNNCPENEEICHRGLAGNRGAGVVLDVPGLNGVEAFAHELGHLLGLAHSPCGNPDGIDPAFPDAQGRIGTDGFDSVSCTVVPHGRPDFMSYCGPPWIDPYHHGLLLRRIAQVNGRLQGDMPIAVPFVDTRAAATVCPAHLPPRGPGVVIAGRAEPPPSQHPSGTLGATGVLPLPPIAVAGLAVDAFDNPIVAGAVSASLTIGSAKLAPRGGRSIFVAKFRPDGQVAWVQPILPSIDVPL
jgi:hypothetical protein